LTIDNNTKPKLNSVVIDKEVSKTSAQAQQLNSTQRASTDAGVQHLDFRIYLVTNV